MRKATFSIITPILLFASLFIHPIYAHPGRTASDGCHYCRTNCDSWGVPWNERHCHGGGSVQGVQETVPIYTSPTNTPILLPTWTPIPTKTPTPTRTPIPTPTLTPTATPTPKIKAVRKSVVVKNTVKKQKKSFWQWLFGK